MVIVDARNMTLIGHVTAPDNALFGLHSRYKAIEIVQVSEFEDFDGRLA